MRNILLLALVTAACAPQPKRPVSPSEYVCAGYSVMRNGSELKTSDRGIVGRLSWRDSAGEHFVTWPQTPTDRDAIEFVIPTDTMQDAVERTYDTTFGSTTADWRLKSKQVCTARGGYNDVLARYVRGESVAELTQSLSLTNHDETRQLIRKALIAVQRRYYRDR